VSVIKARRWLPRSLTLIAAVFSRWLNQYAAGGYEALESQPAPGAKPVVTDAMEVWLKQTVLTHTPVDFW
jgi:hypothetical protein